MIELWETFLLQMDTEEEGPIKAVQAAVTADRPAGEDHTDDPGAEGEEIRSPIATATDVALEQDA